MPLLPEHAALARAGDRATLVQHDGVTFAVGADVTVAVLDPGETVWSRDQVRVGALPTRDGDVDRPIHGYVRLPGGCLPLGHLNIESFTFGADPSLLHDCSLWLDDPLSWETLDVVRPVPPRKLAEPHWIAHLPHDAVRAMGAFVDTWFSDLPPVRDTVVDLPIPGPLRDLYRAAAGRTEVLGGQNFVRTPTRLDVEDGLVGMVDENQGGFTMVVGSASDDPEVLYFENNDGVPTGQPLSGYLMHFLLEDAAVASPFTGRAIGVEQADLARLLTPVPLRPMRWPGSVQQNFAGPGLIVTVRDYGTGGLTVCAGARDRAGLLSLREPGFDWDHFDG